MNFRASPSEAVEINLAPLIDVVFLLLIFFMVTTTFSKESQIRVQLPDATSAEKPVEAENFLIIQISELGEYAVQGTTDDEPRQLLNQRLETLQRALEQSAGNLTDPMVLIRADRLAPHESVVRAMDAARLLGFFQMTFATDNTE